MWKRLRQLGFGTDLRRSGVTTLTLASGAAKHAFTVADDYTGRFTIVSGNTTVITHT